MAGAATGHGRFVQDGETEEGMQVDDLLGKADDLVDMADGRDLSKAESAKLKKMLDDARSMLKEMNKKPATTSSKRPKAEPKKSMKKT